MLNIALSNEAFCRCRKGSRIEEAVIAFPNLISRYRCTTLYSIFCRLSRTVLSDNHSRFIFLILICCDSRLSIICAGAFLLRFCSDACFHRNKQVRDSWGRCLEVVHSGLRATALKVVAFWTLEPILSSRRFVNATSVSALSAYAWSMQGEWVCFCQTLERKAGYL